MFERLDMDELSETSKSLKPLAPSRVVIVPEQCERKPRTADLEQRKKSVLKSVFLVLLSIFLLVAAICFGLWIIQTRIEYITQNIKDSNANKISSHDQTKGRSFDQKPWLSDKPSNFVHVKDENEDTDMPLKTDDDNLENKEQMKEISFDLKFDRPVVKIGTSTLLMKNAEKVEQWIQDRFESFMNTTKLAKAIDTNMVRKDMLDSNIQTQGVREAKQHNHQHLMGAYLKSKDTP